MKNKFNIRDIENFTRVKCRTEKPYSLSYEIICVKGFGREWTDYSYFSNFRKQVGWKCDQDQDFNRQSEKTQILIAKLLRNEK